jgi:3-methyl-2-oxobutanoate hydroxymethyltransferase
MKKPTVLELKRKKGEHLAMLTAYDFPTARLVAEAGVDLILVGDSLGMVVLGYDSTVPVTVDEMVHHTRAARRGAPDAFLIADMPFLSYQVSLEEAVRNAGRLLQAGAAAVKLEGGAAITDRVRAMTQFGIPVMGHLGMTPQSVHAYGGYKVQAKDRVQGDALLDDARALEQAGAFAVVLEAIPAELARRVTQTITIPTIGVGAGSHCDGQVLVLYDLLGLFDDFVPKFVKPYGHLKADALQALRRYKEEVEQGKFPADSESYH